MLAGARPASPPTRRTACYRSFVLYLEFSHYQHTTHLVAALRHYANYHPLQQPVTMNIHHANTSSSVNSELLEYSERWSITP